MSGDSCSILCDVFTDALSGSDYNIRSFLCLWDSAQGVCFSRTHSKSEVLFECVEKIAREPATKSCRKVGEWVLVLTPWQRPPQNSIQRPAVFGLKTKWWWCPPHSPDLAPCDLFLYPRMKQVLKWRLFLTSQGFIENRWRPLTAFLKILDHVTSSGTIAGIAASSHRGGTVKETEASNLYEYFK